MWWTASLLSTAAVAVAALSLHGSFGNQASQDEGTKKARVPVVTTAKAELSSLNLSIEYRGELDAEVAELSSLVMGRLTQMSVDIGDTFELGQMLARIDATEAKRQKDEAAAQIASADAALQRAKVALEAAEIELARGRNLFGEKLISEQDLEGRGSAVALAHAEVSAAEAQRSQAKARVALYSHHLGETRLMAPFAGAVAQRYLDPGALVQPGARILRLVQKGPLRVRFRVPERELAQINKGMRFEITTQATLERRFGGTVKRLSAEVSRLDRNIAVEGVLDRETAELLPGMYAVVHLQLGVLKNAVVVPSAALVERETPDGSTAGVRVVEGGTARWQPVKVRGSAAGRLAVAPLEPGTVVITLGPDNLRDGSLVRIASEAEE